MDRPSFDERCHTYRRILDSFLRRFDEQPPVIHVPRQSGLRRPYPGMLFHLTPEIFLQDTGTTDFVCPDDRFSLRAGEVAVMPRGVPHGETARNARQVPFRGLVFCFPAGEVLVIVSGASPERMPTVVFGDTFEAPEAAQTVRYLDDLAQPGPRASVTGALRRRSLTLAALSVLSDILIPDRLARRVFAHENPKVRHCHELIRSQLADPALSVESLARQLGCTPDHLSRCFRAETGMAVSATIRQQRLALAKNLLQDPKLNISEIAWACGFGSLNYFVRVFRQAMGQPPRQFQRAMAPESPGAPAARP